MYLHLYIIVKGSKFMPKGVYRDTYLMCKGKIKNMYIRFWGGGLLRMSHVCQQKTRGLVPNMLVSVPL